MRSAHTTTPVTRRVGPYLLSHGMPLLVGSVALARSADAIKLLEMNQEFFPNSADVDATMAEVYLKGGDKDRAIMRYRAALVKRPNDPRLVRRLQELGVTP